MDSENNKMFAFLDRYLMGPMGKISQLRIVRGVMAAGMASIPFTIDVLDCQCFATKLPCIRRHLECVIR